MWFGNTPCWAIKYVQGRKSCVPYTNTGLYLFFSLQTIKVKKNKKSSASLDSCIGVSWLALAAAFMLHIARSFITCLTTSWLITSNHANAVCCCSSLNHSSLLLPMCYIFGIVDLTLISSPDRIFFCHSDPLGGTSKSRAFHGTVLWIGNSLTRVSARTVYLHLP